MSARLSGARITAGAQVNLLGVPRSFDRWSNDHDRIRIFFASNLWDRADTVVSAPIRNRRQSVLFPLPQLNIPTCCWEVPLLEVSERVRTRMVAAKFHSQFLLR